MAALALALLTSMWLGFGVRYFARRKPGYEHWRHTISELGESGAPDRWRVALLCFLPVGLGVWGVLALLPSGFSDVKPMLFLVGLAYVGSVPFPCDAGAPLGGSWCNQVHMLLGAFEYLGGAAALLQIEPPPYKAFALLIIVPMLGMSLSARYAGAFQRIAELSIFGFLVYLGVAALGMAS